MKYDVSRGDDSTGRMLFRQLIATENTNDRLAHKMRLRKGHGTPDFREV